MSESMFGFIAFLVIFVGLPIFGFICFKHEDVFRIISGFGNGVVVMISAHMATRAKMKELEARHEMEMDILEKKRQIVELGMLDDVTKTDAVVVLKSLADRENRSQLPAHAKR